MATYTPKLNLKKPGVSDPAKISDINANMDKLDDLADVFTTTKNGLVPKTTTSNTDDYLRRDGRWATPPDTIYTHPATHSADMIEDGTTNKVVTGTEKAIWNGKQDALGYVPVPNTTTLNGYDLSENRTLDGSDIAIAGYTKPAPSPLAETDTITQALGKLEALTDEAKLKIATLDKTIADYKTAMSELNPNQESTQTATGIGTVAIPKNAGGFVSSTINGLTGTKSVLGDCAIVSRGKNLFNGEWELGYYDNTTGAKIASTNLIRSVNKIRVSPSTQYKISDDKSYSYLVSQWDNSGNYIGRATVASGGFTTTSNCRYVAIGTASTGQKDTTVKTQLELGSSATTYESYKSSTQYISTSEELYSVPNGVCDSITGGLLTRRVQKYTLTAGGITTIDTSGTNFDRARIVIANVFPLAAISDTPVQGKYGISGRTETDALTASWDIAGQTNTFHTSVMYLSFVVAKGTTLAAARSALAGTVIYYQLAVPQEIPVDVSGDLQIYANGSVTVEQKTVDAGLYDGGISVLKTRLPISALTYISKLDYLTGVETPLNVSTAVVASGGLSFTHPDLADGDIVFFEYEFDIDAPVPEVDVEYYDSRYTVLDSVNGKYYRWSVTVANGVPTIAVTEV